MNVFAVYLSAHFICFYLCMQKTNAEADGVRARACQGLLEGVAPHLCHDARHRGRRKHREWVFPGRCTPRPPRFFISGWAVPLCNV